MAACFHSRRRVELGGRQRTSAGDVVESERRTTSSAGGGGLGDTKHLLRRRRTALLYPDIRIHLQHCKIFETEDRV
ncbi:hypothetical protein GN956_G19639 [Arapaima gigas]